MTGTYHRPAPWQFVKTVSPCGQDWRGCAVVASNGHEFVSLEDDPETDIPTARLIAAAPDLLDALKAIVDEFPVAAGTAKGIPHDEQGYGSIYRARAAIARATGDEV